MADVVWLSEPLLNKAQFDLRNYHWAGDLLAYIVAAANNRVIIARIQRRRGSLSNGFRFDSNIGR